MIKSFIYLDEQKMYSLSSQIFEGITEYVLREGEEGTEVAEEQKGPVGSGKVLGDVIRKSSRSTERKFIHDYAFTVFEKFLEQEGNIVELSASDEGVTRDDVAGLVRGRSFVKVRAKATFHDFAKMASMFSEFNRIGEALAYSGAYEELERLRQDYEESREAISDRNKRSKLDVKYKNASDISKIAKARGLYQDQQFLDSMAFITRHGFQDQFEISQSFTGVIFSSCLKRELLRDSADLLIKKYSRKVERDVVVFGLISQDFSKSLPDTESDGEYSNMRAALMMLNEHVANVENSLSGKQDFEIVIDPIAVYFEV